MRFVMLSFIISLMFSHASCITISVWAKPWRCFSISKFANQKSGHFMWKEVWLSYITHGDMSDCSIKVRIVTERNRVSWFKNMHTRFRYFKTNHSHSKLYKITRQSTDKALFNKVHDKLARDPCNPCIMITVLRNPKFLNSWVYNEVEISNNNSRIIPVQFTD